MCNVIVNYKIHEGRETIDPRNKKLTNNRLSWNLFSDLEDWQALTSKI